MNEIEMKEEEQKWLNAKCSYDKIIKTLTKVLKARTKQLVGHLNWKLQAFT